MLMVPCGRESCSWEGAGGAWGRQGGETGRQVLRADPTQAARARVRLGSAGRPEQSPQQAGGDPQGACAARQARGRAAAALVVPAAGDREGQAIRGHGAVGAGRGAGLHDQDAPGAGCGERGKGPWVPALPPSRPSGRACRWGPGRCRHSWLRALGSPVCVCLPPTHTSSSMAPGARARHSGSRALAVFQAPLTDVGALLCSGFQAPEGRPAPVFTWPSVGLASPRKGGWGLEDMRQPAHLPSEFHIPVQGDGEPGPQGVNRASWQDAFLHGHWLSFCTCPGGGLLSGAPEMMVLAAQSPVVLGQRESLLSMQNMLETVSPPEGDSRSQSAQRPERMQGLSPSTSISSSGECG